MVLVLHLPGIALMSNLDVSPAAVNNARFHWLLLRKLNCSPEWKLQRWDNTRRYRIQLLIATSAQPLKKRNSWKYSSRKSGGLPFFFSLPFSLSLLLERSFRCQNKRSIWAAASGRFAFSRLSAWFSEMVRERTIEKKNGAKSATVSCFIQVVNRRRCSSHLHSIAAGPRLVWSDGEYCGNGICRFFFRSHWGWPNTDFSHPTQYR